MLRAHVGVGRHVAQDRRVELRRQLQTPGPNRIFRVGEALRAGWTIESLHSQVRKTLRNKGHFPSDEAATKLIWLALRRIEQAGGKMISVAGLICELQRDWNRKETVPQLVSLLTGMSGNAGVHFTISQG